MPKGHHNNKRARSKPTAVKIAQGTYRRDRAPEREPEPPRGLPVAFKHLSRKEKLAFRRFVGILDGMRVLTLADRDAVCRLAQESCLADEAKEHCDNEGWVKLDHNGKEYKSPWANIWAEARRRESELWGRFGLTPADRTRVNTVPEKPASETPQQQWAEVLG